MTDHLHPLPDVEDLLPWPAADIEQVEQHDRRGTLLTMLRVTPADGGAARPMVLKQYRPNDEEGDGTWAFDVGRRLETAGLRTPALDRVALSHGVRSGALLCEHAPGVSWRSTVGTPGAAAAAAAVGRWVCTLQAQTLDLPPGLRRGEQDTRRQLDALLELGAPDPARTGAAGEQVLQALAEPQPLMPAHGNLHPDNLFVQPGETGAVVVTAIDLDTLAAREAAYDIGYGIAQLIIRSLRRPGRAHGELAARHLLDGYRQAGGTATDTRIAAQASRAVLQGLHYEAVGMRQPQRAAEQYLPVLELLLEHGVRAVATV